ncbi:hypothetical protein ACOYHA_18945 [Klebsiella pneumoniae]
MPLRITPSVAEQEGQQTETEATGAPQKHHYTLNQQVGSITTNLKDLTFVPIPPSKCHEDPLYDGRMIEVLESAKRINADIDYRELVRQRESRAASHNSEVRQTPEEIASNYIFERSQAQSLRKMIVIFDDVLTAGSHYKAMKAVIRTHLPESVIVGLFVARTAREAEIDWFEDLDESDEF